MRGEFRWIAGLARRNAASEAGRPRAFPGSVLAGIGDDAAVLAPPPGHDQLLTTDLLVEDVHFRVEGLDPSDLGWKALAVSVSDIAAMGGRAAHAVVSAAFRRDQTGAFAERVLEGLLACAERYGVSLVGGDTTGTPGPVVLNVALAGYVPTGRAVLRSGARPGDAICVTGALGGSILGRHLRVTPRQEESLSLVQGGRVGAMIDVSDGLSSDLGHILDRSGCGAELWADAIPVHPDSDRLAATSGRAPLEHALHDGEDFELLFTTDDLRAADLARSGLRGTPVARIGRIVADRGTYVLRSREGAGDASPVERRGHDHFRG